MKIADPLFRMGPFGSGRLYACPDCNTLNSADDIKCRKCDREPSCGCAAEHRRTINGL